MSRRLTSSIERMGDPGLFLARQPPASTEHGVLDQPLCPGHVDPGAAVSAVLGSITRRAGPEAGPRTSTRSLYGVIFEMRVYQLANAVRVAPQLPIGGARYCDSVQV